MRQSRRAHRAGLIDRNPAPVAGMHVARLDAQVPGLSHEREWVNQPNVDKSVMISDEEAPMSKYK